MLVRALAGLLARPLRAPAPLTWRALRVDAIVVLGAPFRRDGTLGTLAEERVHVGARLFHSGVADRVLVTGGHGAPPGSVEEREGMARWVRALGVPSSAIVVDRAADSTWKSALYAARLLGRGARVALVTQPFHLLRAAFLFRRAGLEPVGYRIENGLEQRDFRGLLRWETRECLAWVKAWLRALSRADLKGNSDSLTGGST